MSILSRCDECDNSFIDGFMCNCTGKKKYCWWCFTQHAKSKHNKLPNNGLVDINLATARINKKEYGDNARDTRPGKSI